MDQTENAAHRKADSKPKVADFAEEREGDEEIEDVDEDESDNADGTDSD